MDEKLKKWQETGDQEAGSYILAMCAGNVSYLVRKYAYTDDLREELLGEANIGVIEAMNKYSDDHSASFHTYAEYWIKARILRFLTRNAHEDKIFIPDMDIADTAYKTPEEQLLRTRIRDKFLVYLTTQSLLRQQIFLLKVNEHLTYKQIGAKFGIHRKHVSKIFKKMKKDIRCLN